MADSASNSDRSAVALQARRLSIIDFSSEDDSLLGIAPGFLQDDASSALQGQRDVELFVSVDDTKLEELFDPPVDDNKSDGFGQIEESSDPAPQPSESAEPEMIRKNGKCNLRKSLAWDSAFFTCEGFLDAEELSDMISVEKGQKKMLPRIQEEVHRSTDSISTLGSETLTLESVETNLFEDVRASIQRSSKVAIKAGESGKLKSGLRASKLGGGMKEVELGSQRKLIPKIVTKKPSISIQKPEKGTKPLSTCPRPQISQRIKGLDKPIPSTTRIPIRGSLVGGSLSKVEKVNTKIPTGIAGRGQPVSKLPASIRNVPRPSKSSSLASSTEKSDSSGTNSSLKLGKSLPNPARRKDDSGNDSSSSSRSNQKTPLRIPGNKIPTGKSSFLGQIMPSKNLSSNVSPASSISDWSSESVSSSSSLQQFSRSSRDSFSRTSMDLDTRQSVDGQSQNDSSVGYASRASGSKVTRAIAEPPPSSKPSGLRLPSPKIGFFDGAKSALRTPKRGTVSVPSNLPKVGKLSVSPRQNSAKSKLGKSNSERAVNSIGLKPDAQGTSSNPRPKASPISESSKAAKAEIGNKSGNVKNRLTASSKGSTVPPLKFDLEVDVARKGEDTSSSQKTDDLTSEAKNDIHSESLGPVLTIEDCVGEIGSVLNSLNPSPPREVAENAENEKLVSKTELNLIKSSDDLVPISNSENPTSPREVAEDAKHGKSATEAELTLMKNSGESGPIPKFEDQIEKEVAEDAEHGKSVPKTELNLIKDTDDICLIPGSGSLTSLHEMVEDAEHGKVSETELNPIPNSHVLGLTLETPEMAEDADNGRPVPRTGLSLIRNSDNIVPIPKCENPISPRELAEEAKQGKSVPGVELNIIKNTDEKEKSRSEDLDCSTRETRAIEMKRIEEAVNTLTFKQNSISEDNVCLSKPVVSNTSPIINENRKPFSARDSLCNISGSNGEFPFSEERFDIEKSV